MPDGLTPQVRFPEEVARLSAEFPRRAEFAGHVAASAAVHGLPASVNVLGNRNAAGEFVQRGQTTITAVPGSATPAYYHVIAVTFPVAFGSAPRVVTGNGASWPTGAAAITTTGFNAYVWDNQSGAISTLVDYIALGS